MLGSSKISEGVISSSLPVGRTTMKQDAEYTLGYGTWGSDWIIRNTPLERQR